MIRFYFLALFLVIAGAVTSAQAAPAASIDRSPSEITIPVAGGCGVGWHRGPLGACRRNGYYGGVYFGPGSAVVEPGPCGGRGWHRVCNPSRCWRVCN